MSWITWMARVLASWITWLVKQPGQRKEIGKMRRNLVTHMGLVLGLAAAFTSAAGVASAGIALDFGPDPLVRFRKAPELQLTCPRPGAAPVIDGKLDDAAWQNAGLIKSLGPGAAGTTVRVCADEHALYIAVACDLLRGRAPTAETRERDSGAYNDDCIEMWLAPDLGRAASYQFVVNAANSIYDALNFGGRNVASHNPAWQHATDVSAAGWTVEAALPFAALEMPRWQRRIGFNIGRNGPGATARAWNGKYGDATGSVLVLPDAPEREVAEQAEEVIAADARVAHSGAGLRVGFERLSARPGERWIEGRITLRPGAAALAACRVRVALFPLGASEPVAETEVAPEREQGTLAVDLRRHGLAQAKLRVTLLEAGQSTGCAEAFLTAAPPAAALPDGTRIPVSIDLPAGIEAVEAWPVTIGVPFAPGTLWDADRVRLVDAEGRALPCQRETVGRWARDGAVKWLRLDGLVNSQHGCRLEVGAAAPAVAPAAAVTVTARDDAIVVDTGTAVYTLGPGASPIREIRRNGRVVATSTGARGLYVIDQDGNTASAAADGEDVRIEARGPVAACIRFEGYYRGADGAQVAGHVTRLEFFAGQPFVQVTHTFTITNDTNQVWFKDIGWELAVAPGSAPKASFGIARDDWRRSTTQPLGADDTVAMLQDRHYVFAHGDNHFAVARLDASGAATTLLEGEECGDWAALTGSAAGLLVSCRETARQHPKEFALSAGKVNLKLHSSRGGETLDFRMPALVERWDLQTWHEKSTSASRRVPIVERALEIHSNAIGWSRTSFLCLAPLTPDAAPAAPARLSRLTSAQVYAHVAPAWVCASGALGPIHPQDPERFPEAERAIDAAFRYWEKRIGAWGDYGFMYYFNGPHLGYRGNYVVQKRYSKAMYTLKVDIWRIYARSGSRAVRTFIENVARTFMDMDVAQYDGDGRVKGLFHWPPGSDLDPATPANLPMPWGGAAAMNYSSTTNMNLVAWDYYLTGNRRALDIIHDYAAGIKRFWTPTGAARNGRSLMVFRNLVQAYSYTWDPELRALAEATTDQFYDPQGELALSKNRPYSSTYKTQVDIRAIEDGWNILGGRRYHEMLMKMAARWWLPLMGEWPHFYSNPQGRIGSLLYRETGRAHIPQVLATQVRYSASAYDPEKDHTHGSESAANSTFVFEGLPYAMETLVRSGADRNPTASWIAYEDFGYPAAVVVAKGIEQGCDLYFRSASQGGDGPGTLFAARPQVDLLDPPSRYGLDTSRVTQSSAGAASTIRIAKDAPGGGYRVTPAGNGLHLCYADSRVPMVLYAPEYWRPAPAQKPAVRYFFNVPEGTTDGQMFFEGSAQLFEPDGTAWAGGEPQRGWIALPPDKPGLWCFLPVENELVSSRNIPPFFAAEAAENYFEPAIAWSRKPVATYEPPAVEEVFVAGCIDAPGNQAVHLGGKRFFRLAGGEPHPSGDGLQFVPFKQGTVEFWMKPNWHTCDLQPEGGKALIYLPVKTGDAWSMWHNVKPRSRNSYHDFLFSHVLYASFMTDGLAKPSTLRRYRRTVFEPGEWTHVAWVWGQEDGLIPGNPPYHTKVRDNVLVARIFINGRQGRHTGYRWYGNEPRDMPNALEIGRHYLSANINAAIDELRVSDVQRYAADFTPARNREFEPDEHTRALFHFNGDVHGLSWGTEAALPAELVD